jgi:hypothetical protein
MAGTENYGSIADSRVALIKATRLFRGIYHDNS